jgi:ribosomal protein S18 acetylase RimI-like enzyme
MITSNGQQGRVAIRPYEPGDRAGLLRVGADTAFFGAPVETFMEDRRLFGDALYAYYTDLEPGASWVASVEGRVIGFVVGSVDTARQQRRWQREILPQVVSRALRGGYRLGRQTWRFALRAAGSWLRREFPRADLSAYPAHLHINVAREWRGQGLGRRLLSACLEQLCSLGVPGVHLSTSSLNEEACHLYEKVGFTLLDTRPTHYWAPWVDRPVENRCYGLRLA